MSTSLTRLAGNGAVHSISAGAKRHTSNSASAKYLNEFKRRQFDYYGHMGGEAFPLISFPKFVSGALAVESAMLRNGKQPLTHSTPAILRPSISLTTKLSTITDERLQRFSFHQQLRVQACARSVRNLNLQIQKLCEEGNETPDHHPEVRQSLISTNYGLLSNPVKGESSAYYVGRNWMADKDVMKGAWIASAMIREVLVLHDFSESEIDEIVKEYLPLLEGYMSLPLGDLYVLGVPNGILPRVAFDCKSYGVPTYKNPQDVLTSLDSCDRVTTDGGHQARVVVNKYVLKATSGVDVVYANDSHQVKKYVEGQAMTPAEEVEVFSPLKLAVGSPMEDEYRAQKLELDKKCALLEGQILKRAKEYAQK